MSALSSLLVRHTDLTDAQTEHLHNLVAHWQLLADLSFADLLLWVHVDDATQGTADDTADGGAYICVAQCRPTTGPTAHIADRVGMHTEGKRARPLRIASREKRIFRAADPDWADDVPVRHEAIPVVWDNRVIAVLGRDANMMSVRGPSQLELTYLQSAADLCAMVADGTFPAPAAPSGEGPVPRAGDGLLRLDPQARVLYASPNALSALRRMGVTGDVVGVRFADVVGAWTGDGLESSELVESVTAAAAGRATGSREAQASATTVLFWPLPLTPGAQKLGALVLLQDVTELRTRDRQILSKDATIREIHHRVKNNLQTVAALLRLQARRVAAPQARVALEEAMRRVSAIALVHETLSTAGDGGVDFDDVMDRLLVILDEVTAATGRILLRRVGSFGSVRSDQATALVMILAELVQNAVEHGFGPDGAGTVEVRAQRVRTGLDVAVVDDGVGLPAGFDPSRSDRLGLQIVRTLASADLQTQVQWTNRDDGTGTVAALSVALQV